MAYHDDLLMEARSLVHRDPRRPKQMHLRRAVSAAYYALFHLLIDDASRLLISGASRKHLRQLVRRAFAHTDMKRVSQSFAAGQLSQKLLLVVPNQVSNDLRVVALTFVDLQVARHVADYDLSEGVARHA